MNRDYCIANGICEKCAEPCADETSYVPNGPGVFGPAWKERLLCAQCKLDCAHFFIERGNEMVCDQCGAVANHHDLVELSTNYHWQ